MYLIIDANSIAHQAKHSLALNYDGAETGVIFGFLLKIIRLAKAYNTNQFVFTWDSKTSLRKQYFPAYKAKRHNKTEEEKEFDHICYSQFDKLKNNILPSIGFRCYEAKGYESDDLIASIVYSNHGEFIIISTDNDLYQLLSKDCSILKKELYTLEDFKNEYGISTTGWSMAKAIAGCISDEIPGISGVGIKIACKFIKREMKVSSTTFQHIKQNQEIVDFNMPLILLPYKGTPTIVLEKESPTLSYKAFKTVCTTYGFRSFLEKEYLQKCQKVLNLQ